MVGYGSSVGIALSSSALESTGWVLECVYKYAWPLFAVTKILLADINKKIAKQLSPSIASFWNKDCLWKDSPHVATVLLWGTL